MLIYRGFHGLRQCDELMMALRTSSDLMPGSLENSSAACAATMGAAKEVPDQLA